MSKAIAILGCSSSVGKTTIATALCNHYSNNNAAPFKAFNLSSESFIYQDHVIGYAQYVQSIAAKTTYKFYMNPILKSYKDNQFEIYVNGKKQEGISIEEAKNIADSAYQTLKEEHDILIVEGSGSICELNILDLDIANTAFALKHNIPIILVADISRGGVFGTLYGHLNLLDDETRKLVKGVIINKFDGDPKYFKDGIKIIEDLCKTKVVGVVPTIKFDLPDEDTHINIKDYCDEEIENGISTMSNTIISNLDIKYLDKILL